MNNKDLQIKGSILVIEKNVKDLKLSIGNFSNQKRLGQRSGVKVYNFRNTMPNSKKQDQNKTLENMYHINMAYLNSIKLEVERLTIYLSESMENTQNTTELMSHLKDSSIFRPKNVAEESSIFERPRQKCSFIQKNSNACNTSKLVKPTNFRNISISSSCVRVEKAPISNFRQPFPRSYANSQNRDSKNIQKPNISVNRSVLSRFESGKNTQTPSFNISMSMNNKITISQTPKNSIPKPLFNSMARQNIPPSLFKKTSVFQNVSKSNVTSECAAHSIDSSKLPLGNIEKMLTPIQKPKNSSVNSEIGCLALKDQKLSQPTHSIVVTKHNEKRKTEDIIKFSQIELGRIKDLNENIDPNMLEKLGDQTLAECFAILQNTTLS